jgi:predicted CXXCH cytochrome family protein
MKNMTGIYIVILVIALSANLSGHIDNYLIPEECGSCHVGHGLNDEPMLSHSEEHLCYQCHGSESNQSLMKSAGRLAASANLHDMELEFRKAYRHPVAKGTGHSPTEKLDGLSSISINHAECVDCHNPHSRIEFGNKYNYEVSGLSLSGQYLDNSSYEYEICLKCHATVQGPKSNSINLRQSFSLTNKSQHPVTTSPKGSNSKSLKISMGISGTMKCSDCHTNDDENGPKGPHGSRHKYLLSGNYDMGIFAVESSHAYEFCYSCHDQSSILSNESFPFHKEHIIGDPLRNVKGTSCYTCHSSHGSETNPFLIDFNPDAVTRDSNSGLIRYISTGNRRGECYLNCHGYSHNPGKY